jgi:predicted dehydrogenase
MIRIGIAGIGFMGMIHYLAAGRAAGARVTAVQSRDPAKRAGDWRGIRGNFGPPGAQMDLAGVTAHAEYADLLADPDVDLIDLTVPTAQHEPMAIAAVRAGKHVLVEKPIALDVAAADRMLAAARDAGRLLMVAHVLPCFPEFRFALEAAADGRFGRLLAGHFTRVIAQPDWSAAIADRAATGGPALDLHVHDTHFIRTLAGRPDAVVAVGLDDGGVVRHLTTLYCYAAGPALSCASGALVAAGRPFAHGFELYFERATLTFGPGQPLAVITADGAAPVPVDADPIAAFAYEIERAAAAVATGTPDGFLAGATARDAVALCHAEIEAVRTGRPVAPA